MLKRSALFLIRFYQKHLSRMLITANHCRFIPTCSNYTYQAIEKYGTIKGSLKGLLRIIRCHPFSRGGLDPVK